MSNASRARATDPLRWAAAFFLVTYLVTGLLWLPILLSGRSLDDLSGVLVPLFLLATVTPSLVAIALSALEDGRRGVGRLLEQAVRWRFGLGWYAIAILLAPAIALAALFVGILLGGRGPVVMLDFLLPLAPIGEELGWRGYVLPRLQTRIAPVPASLVIGVIWAAWHLPYFAYPAVHPSPVPDFALFTVAIVSESVLATWLYNSTNGSVLATMIFHESIHVASLVPGIPGLLGTFAFAIANAVAAIGAVIVSGGTLTGIRRRSRDEVPIDAALQP